MRLFFGGGPADVTVDTAGNVRPGIPVLVYAVAAGWTVGAQVTDFAAVDGTVLTVLKSDGAGRLQFRGPDDGTDALWVDAGSGKYLMLATRRQFMQSTAPTVASDGDIWFDIP